MQSRGWSVGAAESERPGVDTQGWGYWRLAHIRGLDGVRAWCGCAGRFHVPRAMTIEKAEVGGPAPDALDMSPLLAGIDGGDNAKSGVGAGKDGNKDDGEGPQLETLPEELLLRIIAAAGGPRDRMRQAYVLGATCGRLRGLLQHSFLPSLSELNKSSLEALSLTDPASARCALMATLERTCALKQVFLSGFNMDVFTPACYQLLSTVARGSLRVVDLAYSYLDDEAVRPLMHCANLESLSLYGCSKITGKCFDEPGRTAPLRTLNVSYMHGFEAVNVDHLAMCGKTEHLKAGGLYALNSAGVAVLTAGTIVKSLKSVALNFCPINDHALSELIEASPNLKSLSLAKHTQNLWETGAYTLEAVEVLNARYPHLKIKLEH